ncbi:hypothetical protein AAFF_G00293010 [Aldrovandia affinis]|uniref:Uncharacterized protein n=1 Tax=Aldrovandia affinis TaxID=143900 RepID=A0AAD7WS48_9TELE|nr:hypothetical protein AAFF_G00293010 [Aldrovandia affinis]
MRSISAMQTLPGAGTRGNKAELLLCIAHFYFKDSRLFHEHICRANFGWSVGLAAHLLNPHWPWQLFWQRERGGPRAGPGDRRALRFYDGGDARALRLTCACKALRFLSNLSPCLTPVGLIFSFPSPSTPGVYLPLRGAVSKGFINDLFFSSETLQKPPAQPCGSRVK